MTTVLAVNNFGDTREGSVAGPLGGVIVLLLLIGTILLIRNMNARLRRLPRTFPPPTRNETATPTEAPAAEPNGGENPRSERPDEGG